MAASDSSGDDSLYPIAVLIDELKNEDVQVSGMTNMFKHAHKLLLHNLETKISNSHSFCVFLYVSVITLQMYFSCFSFVSTL
jgi:hypothetical protein